MKEFLRAITYPFIYIFAILFLLFTAVVNSIADVFSSPRRVEELEARIKDLERNRS